MTIHPAVRRLLALGPETPPQDEAPATEAGRPTHQDAPWEPVAEPGRHDVARRAGRGLLWAAVILFVLLGVRSLFTGHQADRPATTGSAATFPAGDAQAIATRFITAYLTLPGGDQAAQDARKAALAQDTPLNLANTWNGIGTQTVLAVLPAQVHPTGNGSATVRLLVEVAAQHTPAPTAPAKPAKGKKAPAPPPQPTSVTDAGTWLSVTVPVQTSGGRVVVAGAPAFTSNPAAGQVRTTPVPSTDAPATARTRDAATAFFQAWAGHDTAALNAATAPGARVAPLGSAVQFDKLVDWQVYDQPAPKATSTGNAVPATTRKAATQREAGATVQWRLPSGAVFTQTYQVTLRAVTGSGVTDWRVADATTAPDGTGGQ